MGSYTTNYKFFKADPNLDFVDVNRDVNANMTIIDELLYEMCKLDVNNLAWNNQPTVTYANKHLYSQWTGGIRIYDNAPQGVGQTAGWQPTHASDSDWKPFASYLYGSWVEVPGFLTYWRVIKEDLNSTNDCVRIELRGRIRLTSGYSPIVQDTNYTICNALPGGYMPLSPTIYTPNMVGIISCGHLTMGNSPASGVNSNYADAWIQSANVNLPPKSNAQLNVVRRCGVNSANNQSAGNSENYIGLDGIIIPLSRSGANT